MKYKVNDRVRIKSIDWYNENRDEYGVVLIENGEYLFYKSDIKWCGKIVTIKDVCLDEYYTIVEDFGKHRWTDEMIEGVVEPELTAPTIMDGSIFLDKWFKVEQEIVCPEDYEFFDEMGNIIKTQRVFIRKKRKEYPKTYEECCKVLNTTPQERCQFDFEPYGEELYYLHRLLVCRDAYWKIAGEEIGLGKPWEPDWKNEDNKFIIQTYDNEVGCWSIVNTHRIFAFPTPEMRDAFKKNFDPDIEICKEFL